MAQSNPDETEYRSATTLYRGYQRLYRLLQLAIGAPARILESVGVSTQVHDRLDAPTRSLLLATALPLVDGVFPSIVLAGTLGTISGMLVTAGTIFGGPWMLTIMVSEMAGDSITTRLRRVAHVAAIVIPSTGVIAILAPTVASLLAMSVFHVASAMVLFTVGGSVANDGLAELLPAPRTVVAAGLVVSVSANIWMGGAVEPVLVVEPTLVLQATMTAALAFMLAAAAAIVGPRLDKMLNIDRFRIGSGIALALVPLSIAGIIPSLASLAVFLLAGVFALQYD